VSARQHRVRNWRSRRWRRRTDIDGLSVDFEGFKAVNGVSMVIEEGNCACCRSNAPVDHVDGPDHGKTSRLGRVFLHDTTSPIGRAQDRPCGLVGIQIPSVFKELTVPQSRSGSCKPRRVRQSRLRFRRQRKQNVDEVLELIGLATKRIASPPISVMARPMAGIGFDHAEPKIILLDEPTPHDAGGDTRILIVNNLRGRHTIMWSSTTGVRARNRERITVLHLARCGRGNVAESRPIQVPSYLVRRDFVMLSFAHVAASTTAPHPA